MGSTSKRRILEPVTSSKSLSLPKRTVCPRRKSCAWSAKLRRLLMMTSAPRKLWRPAIDWLDENFMAEKEDYDEQYKELDSVVTPIIEKLYARKAEGGEEMPQHDEF